jgi:hypothetical protein
MLPVTFSIKRVPDERRARLEGRAVEVDQEWLSIRLGQDVIRRPVDDRDRTGDFALEYAAWKAGHAIPGTPLTVMVEEAPDVMTGELADELTANLGVKTLEQLVALPDSHHFMNRWSIQKKAQEILEARAERAAEAQDARREAEAESQRQKMADLEAKVARLTALLEAREV